jgi:ribosome-associated heat shock protein Hsp15
LRLDKFLSCVNIVKRRSISSDMIEHNVVLLNGIIAKASKEVKVGDEIEIKYLEEPKKYKILAIPTIKSTPKADSGKYWEQI